MSLGSGCSENLARGIQLHCSAAAARQSDLKGSNRFADKEYLAIGRIEFWSCFGFDTNSVLYGSPNPEPQRIGYALGMAVYHGQQVNADNGASNAQ